MPIDKSDILILLPAFNEASVIANVIGQIQQAGYTHICVINDGSTDETRNKAKSAGAIVLTHPINRGAGAAVQTGLTYARRNKFQYAITMDSDGQHIVADAAQLMKKMEDASVDIVIGNRFILKDNNIPIRRLFYNRLANFLTNLFCTNSYNDTQSGFRLFNRAAIERLRLKTRGYGFCSEMLITAEHFNLQVEETPIQVIYTKYSLSKGQNFLIGVKTARSILWRVIFE